MRDPDQVAGLVKKFRNGKPVPPIWMTFGRKMAKGHIQGWHDGIRILDGNHRVTAAKVVGLEEIVSIMPISHYEFYKKSLKEKSQ